ncbi:probable jasmonic acid carboxyl methyltransferase 2, partial [Triticum aestivum]|uniref:probable jasmonic acid carboxyl methyltransferase 2 n=1 Tax=Triticum aestivum TaxID=4565 RepID=UPI001D032459
MEVIQTMQDDGNSIGVAAAIYEECGFLARNFSSISFVHCPRESKKNAQQNRMKPLIDAAIGDFCGNNGTLFPGKMVIADLGCSSGPNALTLVSTAVEAIMSHSLQFQHPPPEVSVLLNDLPHNDFNMVVKSLVTLRQSNNKFVLVTGVTPGSFYERLFTSDSMHLICSSNNLHLLSKAPEDLSRNHIPAYDTDEHARHERLRMVRKAYARQFRKDFTLFLKLRDKELVPGGRMVLSLVGRCSDVIASNFFHIWETAAQILGVIASKGVIAKEKFDSFYIPMYGPSAEELKEIIE